MVDYVMLYNILMLGIVCKIPENFVVFKNNNFLTVKRNRFFLHKIIPQTTIEIPIKYLWTNNFSELVRTFCVVFKC